MFNFFKPQVKEVEVKVVDKERERELEYEIKQLKRDFESDKRILEKELGVRIIEAVSEEEKKRTIVEKENAVLKKEVEILEKAFENMGFDVKDMKDILNKLVDGIVSKNEINVIK